MSTSTATRVALVTGAANGIGRSIAVRLARDGLALGLLDIDADGLASVGEALVGAGARIVTHVCDVAEASQVEAACQAVRRALGAPSIVINNAGMARDVAFRDMKHTDWDEVHGVHLRGSFLVTRSLAPEMIQAGWGRILCISSISAMGHAMRANYCAAKAGLEGFVRALAVELGPHGITANAIAPGLIVTGMTTATAQRKGLSLQEHLRESAARIPVRRAGRPEDIAGLASFLVGEESGFISGQTITVSGGQVI